MTPSEGEKKFPKALTNIIEHQEKKSEKIKHNRSSYSLGDQVRTYPRGKNNHFWKGTLRKWSAELFTITNVPKLKKVRLQTYRWSWRASTGNIR